MPLLRPPAAAAEAFRRDGYTVLPGFLDRIELGCVRAEVDALLAGPLPTSCVRPHNVLAPLRWNHSIVARVLGDERRIRRLAKAVDAEDLRWISGYISVKEPRSAPLAWHQDWWCWDHPVTYRPGAAQVAVLCYVTDTDAANGALRVLPGSHHRSTTLHAALPEPHAHAVGGFDQDHAALRDQAGQVTLAVRAGNAVIADYRLLHGTHPNTTARRRACVLLSFTPAWTQLPGEIRAHLIQHSAVPTDRERPAADSRLDRLLPRFDRPPRDLPLNRLAPSAFAVQP